MSATANSLVQAPRLYRAVLLAGVAFAAALGLVSCLCAADNNPADPDQLRAHARRMLAAAQLRHETEPTNSVAAWQVGVF